MRIVFLMFKTLVTNSYLLFTTYYSLMKKIYLLCFLLMLTGVKAQELNIPTFTQYLADSPFIISPAYAGVGDYIKVRANALTQWVGVKDAPDMQSLAGDARITAQDGVGAFLYNDRNGNTYQKGMRFSYAHHLILDDYEDEYLSLGLSFNVNSFRIATENLSTPDFAINDDRYTLNNNFDVSFLYRLHTFYASVTASNIFNKDLSDFNIKEPNRLRNYQFYTGYVFRAPNSVTGMEVEPSAYVQYFESDHRSSTDLNLKFRWKDLEEYYWVGASYRFLNDQIMKPLNIGPMVGLKKGIFYGAYSYQITTNEFLAMNSGTHMITLGLDIFQGISNCPCTQTHP